MVKFLKNTFLVLTVVLFATALLPTGAFATVDKITICHATGQSGTDHFVTLELPYQAVYGNGGHFNENGTPQAGHEDDYLGACVGDPTEEPTETVEPTDPPTEEPTETVTPTEVTEVPTETQVPTENPTEEPIVVLPLTGADNNSGGHSRTLFSFALGSLGMALVLAGVEKKLVLDK